MITVETLQKRLEGLYKHLTEEGWHVHANTAALALEAFPNWRPIDTAPRDGTRILVFDPNYSGRIAACEFDSYNKWIERGHDYASEVWGLGEMKPTHWAPLPLPPKSAER